MAKLKLGLNDYLTDLLASTLLLNQQSLNEPGGHMKRKIFATALMSSFLIMTACSHKKDDKKKEKSSETASLSSEVTQEGLNQTIANWPEASKSAIKDLTKRFGLPAAVTEDMVVWNDSKPFKRSVVYREEINHMFPIQHSDVLLQTLNYRVPLDKVSDLSRFDGSLIVDRTKGELSARNHRQEMNILAFNLADKIVRGEMTVESARREYRKNAEALMSGTTNKMLTNLNFKTRGNTSDPDTMMQSQEPRGSSLERRPEAEAVDVIIIEEREDASRDSMEKEEERSDSQEDSSLDSGTELDSFEDSSL
jgi:hypothetical protein